MYKCLDCGALFDAPIIRTEQWSWDWSYQVETCPVCGSDDLMIDWEENDD